ncbi:uncharacterized protein LOC128675333 isoform X2 [Plodia interpunctella]|uniref:uncharacterized protein LOC128675333 isoform X2 n=1 Tax=Plodia interpunctella TaxID=58824 RepID=UPI0023674AF5|nr:uncharacterized protein LOC128675333 isoform X2 [Plodia interpunctella]
MESLQNDVSKLPQMVMCGDHPSVTKADTAKDDKEKDKPKEKPPMSYARISPTSSATERTARPCLRASSEHAVQRRVDARRRVLSADIVGRAELEPAAPPDRSLVQALGSFRWPPYLLCVWVLVLLLTHALHALVAVLEHTLPTLKKFCQYFRTWTEQSWRADKADKSQRAWAASLAALTALLYALYCAVYSAHCVCVWAVEPLCAELDDDSRLTEYAAEGSNTSIKQ